MCSDAEARWRWSDVSVWLTAVVCVCACERARAAWHYSFSLSSMPSDDPPDACVTHSSHRPSHTFSTMERANHGCFCMLSEINKCVCVCMFVYRCLSERICPNRLIISCFCFGAPHNYAYEVSWVALRRWATVKQSETLESIETSYENTGQDNILSLSSNTSFLLILKPEKKTKRLKKQSGFTRWSILLLWKCIEK